MKDRSLFLLKHNKCAGCKALGTNKKKFVCKLSFKISQYMDGGVYYRPVPAEKCYRPKTDEVFKKALKQKRYNTSKNEKP